MERQTAGHGGEGGIGEGEVVCVHLPGLDLRHVTEVAGQGAEHVRRAVDGEDRAAWAHRLGRGAGDRAAPGGDVQHPLARPQAAPGDQVAAEGREERDVLVVLAGQFVEEPQHGRRIRHGSHPVTRATGAQPDIPPTAHAPFPGSCQRPLVQGRQDAAGGESGELLVDFVLVEGGGAPRPIEATQPRPVRRDWALRRASTWHKIAHPGRFVHYAELRELLIEHSDHLARNIDTRA
jgi:hypothetical protein